MYLQLGLSYRAVYGAVNAHRMAVLSNAEDDTTMLGGEIKLDEAYFGGRRNGNRGRGAAGNVPVFGILETEARVHVSVVLDVSAAELLRLTIKKVYQFQWELKSVPVLGT
jgi:transposase